MCFGEEWDCPIWQIGKLGFPKNFHETALSVMLRSKAFKRTSRLCYKLGMT